MYYSFLLARLRYYLSRQDLTRAFTFHLSLLVDVLYLCVCAATSQARSSTCLKTTSMCGNLTLRPEIAFLTRLSLERAVRYPVSISNSLFKVLEKNEALPKSNLRYASKIFSKNSFLFFNFNVYFLVRIEDAT